MGFFRTLRHWCARVAGDFIHPPTSAPGSDGPLDPAGFVWVLASLASAHGISGDTGLALQSFPAPHRRRHLLEAAPALGLRLEPVALRPGVLDQVPRPCVAFVRETPAAGDAAEPASVFPPAGVVLIVAADADAFLCFVPGAETPHRVPRAAADRVFEPMVFGAARAAEAPAADPDAAPAAPFGFRWFLPELLRHRTVWRDVLIASLAIQVVGLAMPLCAQIIIDKVVVHRTLGTLGVVASAAALFVLFGAAMTWVRQYLVLHTGNRIDAVLGQRVFSHLLRLPPRYFEQRSTGTVVARLHGIEVVREFVSGAAVSLLLDLPFLLVFLAVMFAYSWQLALIAVGGFGLIAALSVALSPWFRARLDRQFLLGARNQAFVTEYVSGLATAKALQIEPQLERRYGDNLAAWLGAGFRTRSLSNGYQVLVHALEQGTSLAILLVGAFLVMRGEGFTIGMLVAFQMFASRMAQPLLRLAGLWQEFQQASVAVQRLGDLMNAPEEPYSLQPRHAPVERGRIVFEAVHFRYGPRHPWLLREVAFALEPGELTVVVGPSGTGKSTLVKLLIGFEQPVSGRILVDGRDAAWLSANELRAVFGVVPQETVLFSGTILENLALADPAASFDEITMACRLAEVHGAIEALPEGYATRIGEHGAGLSGGQRQRIAIARALLKKPRVLVFDEATSHLDAETAAAFAATINALRGKVTMLFIAHVLPRGLMVDRVVRLSAAGGSPAVSAVAPGEGAMPAWSASRAEGVA